MSIDIQSVGKFKDRRTEMNQVPSVGSRERKFGLLKGFM